jgi:TIR domain
MADIFVSYTSSDRDWAFWIGHELEALGHKAHIHEWEISGGGDIAAWMEERHDKADHILCVISQAYLKAPYSSWERRAAQWASASGRPNFGLPAYVENCESPTMLAQFKRCDLYGITEDEARAKLAAFLAPAAKPAGPMLFPALGARCPTSRSGFLCIFSAATTRWQK